MNNNTSYKDSPLGKIPNDWEVRKIGDITKTTAGGTPSTSIKEYWGGNIRWMSSGELNLKKIYEVEGRITEVGLRNSSTKYIPIKCVLIGLAGQGKTRGTVAMNMIELCTNQSVAAIYPSEIFYEEYLFYNLDYRYDELRQLSTGDGGRGGLNLNIINSIKIPLPILPEQRAIATCLSVWDDAITNCQLLIDKCELRKKWLMQQLLSGKKKLKGFEKEKLKKVKLGDVAKINMGQSPDSENYNEIGEGLPLIQGNADIKERKSIIRYWTNQLTKICNENEIIMTVRAPVGAIGIASIKSCIGRGVCSIKADKVDHKYLYYWLVNYEDKWKTYEQGSTFTAVSSKDIYNLSLIIHNSFEEQSAIANVLQAADKEIQLLKTKTDKLKEQKKGLMQVLLTGKKRLNCNLLINK